MAQIAQMRYFGAYSEQEIAETLNITERTVPREWEKARDSGRRVAMGGLAYPIDFAT